jgi:hypothetical protein
LIGVLTIPVRKKEGFSFSVMTQVHLQDTLQQWFKLASFTGCLPYDHTNRERRSVHTHSQHRMHRTKVKRGQVDSPSLCTRTSGYAASGCLVLWLLGLKGQILDTGKNRSLLARLRPLSCHHLAIEPELQNRPNMIHWLSPLYSLIECIPGFRWVCFATYPAFFATINDQRLTNKLQRVRIS